MFAELVFAPLAHQCFEAHQHLIRATLARRFPFLLADADAAEDAWSEGALGLLRACEEFNPARGAAFPTFAISQIVFAVMHRQRTAGAGSLIHRPHHVQKKLASLRRHSERLGQQLGREPQTGEIAAALGVSEAEVDALREATSLGTTLELDAPGVGCESPIVDTLADAGPLPGQALLSRAAFEALLCALTPRQRQVICALYEDDLSQTETAARLGLSQGRVGQLHQQALARLRACLSVPERSL